MIHIVVNCIIISPALWLGGRLLVGGKKAKFSDAILIVVIGTIIGVLVGILFSGFFGSIVQLVLWLLLVKHFFDTGCLMALVISIMAVIVFIIIGGILGIL
ncbi:MAG: hypothetical protein QG670_1952, partial [Thermoproteota archaeon]|nr:hypothetical protein [Thermoproteota archaeon]